MRAAVLDALTTPDAERPPRVIGGWTIAFGLVLPWLCLLLDPMLFTTPEASLEIWGASPMFPGWRPAAFVFVGLQTGALLLHALARPEHHARQAVLGGILLVGVITAGIAGVLLLPLSILGTFIAGIGLFGFVPFGTAAVFAPAAGRAMKRGARAPFAGVVFMLLGIGLAVGLPLGIHGAGRHLTEDVIALLAREDAPSHAAAGTRIRWGGFLVEDGEVFEAWSRATEPAARARLADAYEAVAGKTIDERLRERAAALAAD